MPTRSDVTTWRHTADFADPAITTDRPASALWDFELWSGEVPGGIVAGRDFWSFYEGALELDVNQNDNYHIDLVTVHDFGDAGSFTSTRRYGTRVNRNDLQYIPFVDANSISNVPLGTFMGVHITQELLDSPSTITQRLRVQRDGMGNFVVERASISNGQANFRQFGVDLPPDLSTELSALSARVAALEPSDAPVVPGTIPEGATLKQRIDGTLEANGYETIQLPTQEGPERILTTYLGFVPGFNNDIANRVEVNWFTTVGRDDDLENGVARLLEVLCQVDDCYPEQDQAIAQYPDIKGKSNIRVARSERYVNVSVICRDR